MFGLFAFLIIAGVVVFLLVSRKPPENLSEYNYTAPPVQEPPKNFFKPSENTITILKALLFLGKADGQIRDKEIDVIVQSFKTNQPDHVTVEDWYIAHCIKNDVKPFDVDQYHDFINKLDKSTAVNFQILMKRIFGSQKKNHPYEDILLKELQTSIDSK